MIAKAGTGLFQYKHSGGFTSILLLIIAAADKNSITLYVCVPYSGHNISMASIVYIGINNSTDILNSITFTQRPTTSVCHVLLVIYC